METLTSPPIPATLEWWWEGAGSADVDALTAAMETLPVAVLVVAQPPGRPPEILAYNNPFARLVGGVPPHPPDRVATLGHRLFRPDRVTALAPEELPGPVAAATGEAVRDEELHVQRADGSWRVVSATAVPLARARPDDAPRAVVMFLDVTGRWRATELEAALRERETRFRALVDRSRELVITAGPDLRATYVSAASMTMFGVPPEVMLGKGPREFVHPHDVARVEATLAEVAAVPGSLARYEARTRHADGAWRTVDVTARNLVDVAGVRALVFNVRDVTAERDAEARARRARRALLALSQANEAVARAASEQEIHAAVCRVLVETGGYRLCWVGALEHDADRAIRPLARAGHDDGYVAEAMLTWGEDERGRGPVGTAARTGAPQTARDFLADPSLAPWRDAARRRGYRSVAAFPLEVGGAVAAVLSLYAGEADAFDGEELEFLVRLAGDVSHGLAALREKAERARAEEALRASRQELRALAGRLDAIREEEKARIARDLHDELGQLLTGLRVDLDTIEERLGDLPPGPAVRDLVERAVDASGLVSRAVAAVREVLSVLRPAALDHLGLGAALRQECRRFEERTRVACRLELPEPLALGPEVETALFRIAQEALTNVARHAGASAVDVSVAVEAHEAVLRVADDGAGLRHTSAPGRGLGVVGMSERAARLGGGLTLAPGPAGGTVVTARVPLEPGGGAP
jgi:PAS domain S-box-containing protein